MNTKQVGDIGVLAVAKQLAANGITSAFPIGDSKRYDLLLEWNGMFARAQVKSRKCNNGTLRIPLYNKSTRNGKVVKKMYHPGEIEAFIIYDASNDSLYILPIEMMMRKETIYLRVEPPKNQQSQGILWAVDYENDLENIGWIYK